MHISLITVTLNCIHLGHELSASYLCVCDLGQTRRHACVAL